MNQTTNNKELKSGNFSVAIQSMLMWYKFLLKRWWIIVTAVVVGGICGILYAYFEKARYESSLTFALEDSDPGMGGALSLAAELGFNIGVTKNIFEGDNILNLLTSRRIVERTLLSVDTLNGKPITMADYYKLVFEDSSEQNKKDNLSEKEMRLRNVSFPAGQPRSAFSYLQDSVLLNIYKDLLSNKNLQAGKPDKKLNLYEVSVTSFDERFSKIFTDKLIREATDFYVELRTRKSRETLNVLEARVAQTRGNLGASINSRAGLQDANVNPAFQRAQAELQQKQVDIAAYGGAFSELYKSLELARYQYLKDIPLLQIIDNADYPMKKIKHGRLKTGLVFGFIAGFLTVIGLMLRYIFITNLPASPVNRLEEADALA